MVVLSWKFEEYAYTSRKWQSRELPPTINQEWRLGTQVLVVNSVCPHFLSAVFPRPGSTAWAGALCKVPGAVQAEREKALEKLFSFPPLHEPVTMGYCPGPADQGNPKGILFVCFVSEILG